MTGFPMLTLNQNLNPTKRQEILQGARKKCAKKTKIKQRRNHESRRLPVWLSIRPLGAFEEEVRGGRTRNQHAKKKLGVGIDQPSRPNMKGYFCSHYAI